MKRKRPELAKSEIIARLPAACTDEQAARDFIEQQRWGESPACPHCGDVSVYRMTGEKAEARGLLRCHGCKRQFTVRVGTVFEDSKIPLRMWCRAIWEAGKCKNGCSALELKRQLQVTYRTALFMLNRLRHAMTDDPTMPRPPLRGILEADETYVGGRPRYQLPKYGPGSKSKKTPVFAVLQRGGDVRAAVMPSVTSENVREALLAHTDRNSILMTDEARFYTLVGRPFAGHERLNHREKEYVRKGDRSVHTNSIEGFFSRVKRGLNGTYHAVSPEHLHRYVAQFAFMHNTRGCTDGERVTRLIRQSEGKRLHYREPDQAA